MKYLLWAVITCIFYANKCSAMKCYYCKSDLAGACSQEPEQLEVVDCDAPYNGIESYMRLRHSTKATGCMKRVTHYSLDENVKSIVRDCFYGDDLMDTDAGCAEAWPNWTPMIRVDECYVCGSDGCNAAPSQQQLVPVAVMMIFTLLSTTISF